MAREEFPDKIKDQAAIRANGKCEKCGLPFGGKRPEFDHILPCVLGGKPTLANCMALCRACHAVKTTDDIRRKSKADRQRRKDNGAKRPAGKIKSAGFPPVEKPKPSGRAPAPGMTNIARRFATRGPSA